MLTAAAKDRLQIERAGLYAARRPDWVLFAKRNKGKWAAAAILAPKEHSIISCPFRKSYPNHIDDTARIRWAELRGPLSLDPQTVGDGNKISVLVTSQGRLQISADLDVKSLRMLKQMLERCEQILKHL